MRILVSTLMCLLVISWGLMAQQSGSSESPPFSELGLWWRYPEVVEKLQLTEEQVSAFDLISHDTGLEILKFRSAARRREAELKKLMQADPVDQVAVQAQKEKVTAARGELERADDSLRLSIQKVLSGEQWEKLEEMQAYLYDRNQNRVKAPKATHMPKPQYTEEARKNKVEGFVILQMVIHADGSAGFIKVLRGLGYGLDESAIRTITKEWRFEPGTLSNGHPVDVQVNIEVTFKLF